MSVSHRNPQTPPTAKDDAPANDATQTTIRRNALRSRPSSHGQVGGLAGALATLPGVRTHRYAREGWFVASVGALLLLTVFALSALGNGLANAAQGAQTQQAGAAPTVASGGATNGVSVTAAHEQAYHLPQTNPGVMYPAVDAQGNVWFGEMGENALARLDPRTGAVQSWTPPNGHYNIMGVAIDAQGNVWFAEQAGNYIGRFDPQTQTFTTYPLADKKATPQDIVFDAQGRLWFDETVAGRIGRLDPTTGAIQTWPLPDDSATTPAYLYGLALAADGSVWYGTLSGLVGRLDPATGQVTQHHLASAKTEVFAMASDAQGRIWFTELFGGKLGVINTTTGQLAELAVPTTLGDPGGLYGVTVAPDGSVWFASAGANALVRYIPTTGAYTFFQLSIPNSVPYGVALDTSSDGVHLWFTADGQPNYVGVMNA
ncbi:MAG TPA: hypothetical protein VMV29_04510 [Ktedonobacterales bacterium]|nr:hypothetical protein [Ktedonobacterales bacterium]